MTMMAKAVPLKTEDQVAAASTAATGVIHDADGTEHQTVWQLPCETPIAILINTEPFTVMMATPGDLHDFAAGIMVAEGIISGVDKIRGVLAMPVEQGLSIDVAVDEKDIVPGRLARRTIEGRSGCGLCGIEDIASAVRPLPKLSPTRRPSAAAILKAADAFKSHQTINRINRSVHGAAFVSNDGEIKLVREDVGRHNALDKLIGALLRSGQSVDRGFVLMSSRCSFELIQKTVTAGIPALVSVSAPTSLALELAQKSNLFLAALGPGGVVIFNN